MPFFIFYTRKYWKFYIGAETSRAEPVKGRNLLGPNRKRAETSGIRVWDYACTCRIKLKFALLFIRPCSEKLKKSHGYLMTHSFSLVCHVLPFYGEMTAMNVRGNRDWNMLFDYLSNYVWWKTCKTMSYTYFRHAGSIFFLLSSSLYQMRATGIYIENEVANGDSNAKYETKHKKIVDLWSAFKKILLRNVKLQIITFILTDSCINSDCSLFKGKIPV